MNSTKPPDPLEYISASRLKSFLTCRLKFYYERVLGLPSPSSPNLQIGKAVHAGLEAFHRARWEGGESSTPAILEAYHDAYTRLEDEDQRWALLRSHCWAKISYVRGRFPWVGSG